jgi:hypothetical protein
MLVVLSKLNNSNTKTNIGNYPYKQQEEGYMK